MRLACIFVLLSVKYPSEFVGITDFYFVVISEEDEYNNRSNENGGGRDGTS